jgi:hypothetical protein
MAKPDILSAFKVPDPMFKKGPMGTSMAPITSLAPKAKKPVNLGINTGMRMPKLNKFPKAITTKRTDSKLAGFAPGGEVPSKDVLVGPVVSTVPGRTDKHPVNVLAGSYVLPSSHVASLGEENTLAGLKVLAEMFPKSTQPTEGGEPGRQTLEQAAKGGTIVQGGPGEMVPIIIAGGEFVVHPDDVAEYGDGDIDEGHKNFDGWVISRRKKQIKTLEGLAPPAKD